MTLRLTKKRQQILDVLKTADGALTAAEIHAALPELDLSTIYRSLDAFVSEKLIKKIHLDDAEARFEHQAEPHHHAVCTDCHKVIHFTAPDERIKRLLGIEDFAIDELEVTVRGTCRHDTK
ncbi:MAG: Fur family transcriptional regulator [Patescibacteria group bacterium]